MSRSIESEKLLPQVCVFCKKIKTFDQGEFRKDKFRFSKRVWVCGVCYETKPVRIGREDEPETPVERIVKEALMQTGFWFAQEYPVGKFFFDFGIPKLRILIEVDSRTYHRKPAQKCRDRLKSQIAKEESWLLVRIKPSSRTWIEVHEKINERAQSLGLK